MKLEDFDKIFEPLDFNEKEVDRLYYSVSNNVSNFYYCKSHIFTQTNDFLKVIIHVKNNDVYIKSKLNINRLSYSKSV